MVVYLPALEQLLLRSAPLLFKKQKEAAEVMGILGEGTSRRDTAREI